MRSLRTWLATSIILVLTGCSVAPYVSPAPSTGVAVEAPSEAIPAPAQELVAEPFSGELTLYSDEPVFQRGLPGTWDAASAKPGAVVFHDGLFHMFYNGRDTSSSTKIGYAISLDGYTWNRMTEAPVLAADDVNYAYRHVFCSSVLAKDDGTWVMYFSTLHESMGEPAGAVGRATAREPTGPWTPNDIPVLQPGRLDTWDAPLIGQPDVLKKDDGYVMYYTGWHYREGQWSAWIGMATSPDGITWTKHDDPTTTEDLLRDSDAVLGIGVSDWEAAKVTNPRVWRMSDVWGMIYSGASSLEGVDSVGYATSSDGVEWSCFEGNPVLMPENIQGVVSIGSAELLYHDGKYLLYFSATKDGQTWDVYLATSE